MKFSIRDLLPVTVIVALAVGWREVPRFFPFGPLIGVTGLDLDSAKRG